MGFATGFTGGVTLTLSLAYLSVLAHQRNREQQSRSIRAQALVLQNLVDPIPQPLPPTRSEIAAAQRTATIEVAKDRWNEEVGNAVRWVQGTDWDEVREGMEARISGLWAAAFGESAEDSGKADAKLERVARRTEGAGKDTGRTVATAAKGALEGAKERAEGFRSTLEDKALEARLSGKSQISNVSTEVKEKAVETQGIISSTLEKGRDMVGKVKTAVGIATGVAEVKTTSATKENAASPVEKALQQRYEKQEAKANRSVAEVLKERYTPMDQRDNTVLRGL
ncbi:hypothetical protein DCS_01497 [Drechmeria coniospora]|uniref:MICOS complex subunit MIC12 n=1 Tax=Drechmeria coniospora TaxID=98403 RepID=A0A151GTG0_DRECN|nr:hypothetical protein DCS_01497 [Drechmeria coniospora]KYK60360.1 hypothetical protein DCS_01497 [Drechmeria coniospora]ODA80299.1 hypothetical protein RJ55_03257 [Drechmeria coniospora]